MASTYSLRFRLDLQAPGDNLNTWGARLNTAVFQLLEDAIARRVALTVSAPVTLSSNNGATDQARCAFLDCTGTGGTVTTPAVEKVYLVRNGCSGNVTITTGGGRTAVFLPGEMEWCVSDATNYDRLAPRSLGVGPFVLGGAVDMGGFQITNAADPTTPQALATRAYADALAFTANAGILPGQTSNSRKFLTTNGTTASWGLAGFQGLRTLAATDALVATDKEKVLKATVAVALTLTAAATLTADFGTTVQNAGTASITVTPASGTVDGLASFLMYPGEVRWFFNDGTNWSSIVLNPFSKVWTSTDAAFVWPPGYQAVEGLGWGGGGGGGGGGSTTASGGGGGGACTPYVLPNTSYTAGATATVTIGAGGTGGLVTANGGNGGNSSIAALVTFYGGGGGLSAANSGAGGGVLSAAVTNTAGLPTGGQFGGGSSISTGTAGTPSVYGGASGGGGNNAGSGGVGGVALYGGGGGAGGSSDGSTPLGGVSTFGGRGGNASATVGGAGVAPGGGGAGGAEVGGTNYAGGAGARGEVRMRGVI